MNTGIDSIYQFIEAINQGKGVRLKASGLWSVDSAVRVFWKKLFNSKKKDQVYLIDTFNECLDRLEEVPIRFSSHLGISISQEIDFHSYLYAAESIRRKILPVDTDSLLMSGLMRLNIRLVALLYRLEEENGGLRTVPSSPVIFNQLQKAALEWKKREALFWHKELSDGDLKQLEITACYPEFVKLLLTDSDLAKDFFFWSLRERLDVSIYIEFPSIRTKLTLNNLRGRIGRMGGDLLKLQKVEKSGEPAIRQKIVSLRFERFDVSLLDEEKVVNFSGNYRLKIREIFKIFKDKDKDIGNLEIFAQGVINWNSNFWGRWNALLRVFEVIDLDQPQWWVHLPVLEILTISEACKRYGSHLDGFKWNVAAKASREYLNLHFQKSHGYLEIAIPTEDHQYYRIYTFGKCAVILPKNIYERVKMFAVHVLATVVYPDENLYFSHRQHIGFSFILVQEEGIRLMSALAEDMRKARAENFVFQLETDNCSEWIQHRLEDVLGTKKVPNLYRTPIFDTELHGFFSKFFGFFKSLPAFLSVRLFNLVHILFLGGWRGRWIVDKSGNKVWKSIVTSPFWKDTIVYLPSYLHKQHELGSFSNELGLTQVWVRGEFESSHKRKKHSWHLLRRWKLFEDSTSL